MELVTPGIGLIFWQTVTFVIVLFLLSKFAWKPIMASLREREQSIESALSMAERAKLEMQALKNDNEKLLNEARAERDRILKEAADNGRTIIEEAKSRATQESERVFAQAKEEIETQKKAALAEVKNVAATVSIEIAERILKHELRDTTTQQTLVQEYLKDVKLN